MSNGNIPLQGGGLMNILNALQMFQGQSGSSNQRTAGTQATTGTTATTGTQNTAGTQNTVQNLLNQITGSTTQNQATSQTGTQQGTQTQTGGTASTQTTRSDITAEGINRMMQTILESDSGLSGIFSGQSVAGGYGSTTSGLLASDLIARTAGELAKLQAGTTTTTAGTENRTVASNQATTQTGTTATTGTENRNQTQNTATNQATIQNQTSSQNQTNNQNVATDQTVDLTRQADAALDPMKILTLLAGGQLLGPSIGAGLQGLGSAGQSLAGIIGGGRDLIGALQGLLGGGPSGPDSAQWGGEAFAPNMGIGSFLDLNGFNTGSWEQDLAALLNADAGTNWGGETFDPWGGP